jgi:hypothetical protein
MNITKSTRKGKRFLATFKDGTKIHFGQDGGSTYIDHGDEKKREAYIARHGGGGRENWKSPYNAGALSRWILWGPHKQLEANVGFFKSMFRLS